jgi:hypothetical protein
VGIGLAGGLKDVATAPFSNQNDTKAASAPEIAKIQEEAAEKKKTGPRKIEIRGEKA